VNKDRRAFVKDLAGAAVATAVLNLTGLQALAQQPGRPNIVCILGEGLRYDEFSVAGHPILKTPNMDRIAKEGFRFRNAFVINSLCLPSRATVLTGLYSHTTGAVSNEEGVLPESFKLISDTLHDAGYETAFVGKSHVRGALTNRYWDYYFGFIGQADYYRPVITEGFKGKYGQPKLYEGEYVDDLLTRKTIEWLKQERTKPFCLFMWFYAPHAPFYRPRRMVNMFNGVSIAVPPTFNEDVEGYPGKPHDVANGDNKIGSSEVGADDPRSLEELVKDHYAGVQDNDENVGRLIQELERQGQFDKTAILLSSDHGFFLGEHHFYDKRLMYEPSIRVPMMARYPARIPANKTSDKMVLNLDIAPTMLDLAGLSIPGDMQGKSMLPLMQGKDVPWRKDWLYEYYEYPGFENVPPCRGVRTEQYKLIHYFLTDEYELYDIKADPDERTNLYGKQGMEGVTQQLKTRIVELRRDTGDHYEYKPTGVPRHRDPPVNPK
jgi:arylsulfatase A-like enzyme